MSKYRDRLLDAAYSAVGDPFDTEYFLSEVDAIMLEISEREDRLLTLLQRVLDSEGVIDRADAQRDARDFLKGRR